MAATYKQLVSEVLPQVLETEEQYDDAVDRLGDLVAKGHGRTAEETRLKKLLGLLVQDYDRRHAMPADEGTPAEKLQFLMEHSGKTPHDLLPVFATRSHVNEAINGRRPISAEQARKLGAIFNVRPGLFI